MPSESELLTAAESIERHLRVIRRLMRASLLADVQATSLTWPQMHALEALLRVGAMSLKALSRHLALAHSTVSGIVDRLEQRGLVRRETDPADRRGVRISVTPPVQDYMERVMPAHRLGPLLDALRAATDEERGRALQGVATLQRLLEAQAQIQGQIRGQIRGQIQAQIQGQAMASPASGAPDPPSGEDAGNGQDSAHTPDLPRGDEDADGGEQKA